MRAAARTLHRNHNYGQLLEEECNELPGATWSGIPNSGELAYCYEENISRNASYTGNNCSNWKGHINGIDYAIQGNILLNEAILLEMENNFLSTNEVSVGDQPIGTILSQKTQEAKHGQIHMTAEEILAMTRCIRDVKNRPYEIFDDATKKTYKVDNDHWHDAEMYFIIGLSIGWRRQEAFTAICKRIPKGTVDQSGLTINDKDGTIKVWIYTRKTERVGRAYWGGFVLSSDVGVWAHKLIMDKLKRIDSKDPKLKLYTKVWDNPQTGVRETYDMHPLIGRDDQYIKNVYHFFVI